jgi:hypothetical protein
MAMTMMMIMTMMTTTMMMRMTMMTMMMTMMSKMMTIRWWLRIAEHRLALYKYMVGACLDYCSARPSTTCCTAGKHSVLARGGRRAAILLSTALTSSSLLGFCIAAKYCLLELGDVQQNSQHNPEL